MDTARFVRMTSTPGFVFDQSRGAAGPVRLHGSPGGRRSRISALRSEFPGDPDACERRQATRTPEAPFVALIMVEQRKRGSGDVNGVPANPPDARAISAGSPDSRRFRRALQ